MKSSGLLHARLSGLIAGLGHTETLVIADAGLPVPAGVECIDLAVRPGLPDFLGVLEAVMAELVVEQITLASEAHSRNPALWAQLQARYGQGPAWHTCPHEQFKQACRSARAVVRTGECRPYANVILHAGVAF